MPVKSFRGYIWQDRGWDAIRKRMTTGPAVIHARVGVTGANAGAPHPLRDGDLSIEEVALLNEFGGSNQPERSFLRRTFFWNSGNKRELLGQLANVSRRVIFQGANRVAAMSDVGRWGVSKVKQTIMKGVPPKNARATVDNKGHGNTLRHTLTLLNAIDFVIAVGNSLLDGTGD